ALERCPRRVNDKRGQSERNCQRVDPPEIAAGSLTETTRRQRDRKRNAHGYSLVYGVLKAGPTILAAPPDFKDRPGVYSTSAFQRDSRLEEEAMVKPQFLLTLVLAAGLSACA